MTTSPSGTMSPALREEHAAEGAVKMAAFLKREYGVDVTPHELRFSIKRNFHLLSVCAHRIHSGNFPKSQLLVKDLP